MRMLVIPFKTGNKVDLLLDMFNISDNKKQNPANNHKFRDILKFFIKPSYIFISYYPTIATLNINHTTQLLLESLKREHPFQCFSSYVHCVYLRRDNVLRLEPLN
jgi:hypothetical protein